MSYLSRHCKEAFRTLLLEIEASSDQFNISDINFIAEKVIEIGKLRAHAVAYRKEGLVKCALQKEAEAIKMNESLPDGIRI